MRRKKNIIYLSFSLSLFFCLLEMGLRFFGFFQTYSEKINGRYESYYGKHLPTHYWTQAADSLIHYGGKEFNYSYRTNSLGLRQSSYTSADSDNLVLFLGDSFTEGVGAADDSTFPAQTASLLKRIGMPIRAYNAGVPGSDPFFEYVLLKDKLLSLHPHAVIQSVNYSDLLEYIWRGGMERFEKNGSTKFNPAPAIEPLYQHCHVVRMLMYALGYDYTLQSNTGFQKLIIKALRENASIISKMADLCREKQIYYHLIIHPYPLSFAKHIKGHEQMGALQRELPSSIHCSNLYPAFARTLNSNNYTEYSWPIDGHFNAKGYGLFAKLAVEDMLHTHPQLFSTTSYRHE